MSEFDDAVGQVLHQQTQEQASTIRNNLYSSLDYDPGNEAKLQNIAHLTGMPIDVVRDNEPDLRKRVTLQSFNAENLVQQNPNTAQLLQNPDNTRLLHDAIPNTGAVEQSMTEWQPSLMQRMSQKIGDWFGVPEKERTRAQLDYIAGTSGTTRAALSQAIQGQSEIPVQAASKFFSAATLGLIPDMAGSAQTTAGAFGGAGGELAGFIYGAPLGIAKAAMGKLGIDALKIGEGDSFIKALGKSTLEQAATLGIASGVAQTGNALNSNSGADAVKIIANGVKSGVETGALFGVAGRVLPDNTIMQAATRFLGVTAAQDMFSGKTPFQDASNWDTLTPEQKGQALFNYGLNAVFTMGGQGRAGGGWFSDKAKVEVSAEDAHKLGVISQVSNASLLRERNPELFKQFVEQVAADKDAPNIYIDARDLNNALAQSGVTRADIEQTMPGLGKQLDEATNTHGLVEIPLADYATHLAGTEIDKAILPNAKVDPEGMTWNQAEVWKQTQVEQLNAEVQKMVAEKSGDQVWQDSRQKVQDQVRDQLTATGYVRPEVADAYSALHRDFFSVMAARMGVTPEEAYSRLGGAKIVAEDLGQKGFGQITPEQARDTNVPVKMPDHELFTEAVGNTPGAEVTPDGLKLNLVRFQKPNQEGAEAIRTGVFYLPVGSSNAKHYKTGKTGYGGTEKFEGETVLRNPLFVKGATGGKAPEAAYEQVMGKGSMKTLDNDVFSVINERGWMNRMESGLFIERVAKFLSDHGSDPGLASEIVRNSKEGNTLRYALQENVIAHAVRNAGYDSVVGYSKGKAGASISEVFDVREQTFPARGMDSQVHDAFSSENSFAQSSRFNQSEPTKLTTDEFGQPAIHASDVSLEHGQDTDRMEFIPTAENQRMHDLAIMSPDGKFHGNVDALFVDGKPVSLYDVNVDEPGSGWGTKTVKALLDATENGRLEISNILPKAQKFWEKLGISIPNLEEGAAYDGTITRESFAASPAGKKYAAAQRVDGQETGVRGSETGGVGQEGQAGSTSGKLNQGQRGAYDPESKTLALLKGADLSTFLHETGHFFLDTYGRTALLPDAPELVKSDFQTLLNWFGVSDAREWERMSVDEQRESHEKFARGFEAYLLEGKSPNVEMAGLFARFRSWLLNIYQSFKSLNVELTPEVRGVMDRMLASEESIKQAEAVRGYDPLFKHASDAGMTPQEWAEYQQTGSEATNSALENLQSRSIRDMRWMTNLRSKALQDLQSQAASQRRVVRMDARKEVLATPLYQAWQFLTKRMSSDDKVPKLPSGNTTEINPAKDSLLTAIAKLGGLDRESAAKHLGVHKDDYQAKSGVFGKPVFRAKDGMSADAMAESLLQHGYLHADENGAHDLRELEDVLAGELGGTPHHSMFHDYGAQEARAGELHNRDSAGAGRLDYTELLGMNVPKETVDKLEAMRMTSKNGLHPDIVAEIFGLDSGRELVDQLAQAKPLKEAVEARTDQLMLERHGDLATPEAIQRATDEAIHNEVRSRVMATELNALQQATSVRGETGQKTVVRADGSVGVRRQTVDLMVQAARQVANTSIAQKIISQLRTDLFAAAEARAAKNAEKALAIGDIQAAAVEKRAQLLNNRLVRAAMDAQAEVAAGVKYLTKFNNEGTRGKIDVDYRDQIDTLLERFDLRKSTTNTEIKRRQNLMEWVESQVEQGMMPDIPEKLLDEAIRKSYKEMTVEEFRGLVDSVKSIETIGRLKNTLRDKAARRDLDEVAGEAAATMATLPDRSIDSNRGLTRMESVKAGFKSAGRSLQAALLKMEQLFDWLDNRNPNGVFNRVVFQRMSEAGVHENNLRAKVKGEIDKLLANTLDDITKDGGKKYIADGLIDGLTGKPQAFTKKEMLMLAGNMGNESNLSKLLAGENWNERAVWDFLNKNMGKADWDFVAGMGRALESLWPEQVAMNRRLGMTNPEKIEPRPFLTPHGQYSGWYWPMIYDPARAQDVADRGAKKADALFENTYSKANTDTGRMNTRVAGYARPLLLDLDALPRVILDNIHDIAYREAVIDAHKFLNHSSVRDSVVEKMGQEYFDQFKPWLQSIANDGKVSDEGMRAMKWFNSLAHGARTRATIVGLGYRVSTMLIHGSSAAMESIAEMGPKWFGVGLKETGLPFTPQWNAQKEFIFERSGEMRNRMNEVDRDVREHLREIELKLMDPATGAIARATDVMKAHAYQGIAMLDMASAIPTWYGAYLKALEKSENGGLGLGEDDAIQFADKTVRNAHGGTGVKDLAAVQRGPEFFKLFSMFYTFWNHNINRIMDTARMAGQLPDTYKAGDMTKFKGDLGSVMMRTLIYIFGVQIMHHMIAAPKPGATDDETERNWFAWAAKEIGLASTSGIPIVRDLAAHYISGKDYSVTPAASMVDAVGRSGQDIMAAVKGEGLNAKWLKHSITTTGYVFGLPLGQPASAAQFLYDVEQGNAQPQEISDWWRGMIHGDMKKR